MQCIAVTPCYAKTRVSNTTLSYAIRWVTSFLDSLSVSKDCFSTATNKKLQGKLIEVTFLLAAVLNQSTGQEDAGYEASGSLVLIMIGVIL